MQLNHISNNWHDKPYYSLDAYCKNTFNHKCFKIALNAHMTCPNRDGSKGTRGCIFCSSGGSGEFAVKMQDKSMQEQIDEGISLFKKKETGNNYIAYFQAYTNTYAPIEYLEKVYRMALENERICGISIGTRPDCLGKDVLNLLDRLKGEYPEKFIWVELGLQTMHERTAEFIRRGYDLPVFENAVENLRLLGILVIVHVILGLPDESRDDMIKTIDYLNGIKPFGIKLQLLHILKDTDLEDMYFEGKISVLSKKEYLELICDCIAHLSPEIIIHRLTGDGAKELLIAPDWSLNKRDVLNSLHKMLKDKNIVQGCRFYN